MLCVSMDAVHGADGCSSWELDVDKVAAFSTVRESEESKLCVFFVVSKVSDASTPSQQLLCIAEHCCASGIISVRCQLAFNTPRLQPTCPYRHVVLHSTPTIDRTTHSNNE